MTQQTERYTTDEFIAIVAALIAWARIVRMRYRNFECGCCGVSYHPRMGPPPDEEPCPTAKKHGRDACWCGHAHFREAWGEWDEETNDWIPDDVWFNRKPEEITEEAT